jgi:hypothetical protein
MSEPRVLHCWEDRHDFETRDVAIGSDAWVASHFKPNATCMLEDGHDGPHEWTDDGDIGVRFIADDSEEL